MCEKFVESLYMFRLLLILKNISTKPDPSRAIELDKFTYRGILVNWQDRIIDVRKGAEHFRGSENHDFRGAEISSET